MVARAKPVASAVLMYVLFLHLSKAASVPISVSASITSPSENLTSSLLSKLIESSRQDVPSEHDVERRNAVRDRSMRWPNAEVPYELDADFNEPQRQSIQTAMEHFHNQTCIRFVERSNQVDYLRITIGVENWSEVGRQGGDQQITLSPDGSLDLRTVLHELMHTLGFYHEHRRPDRGDSLIIRWNNIIRGRKREFKKLNQSLVDLLNTTYDYSSVMHYGAYAYSKNTRKTIKTKDPFPNLGMSEKLSTTDVIRLRLYYDCECIDRHDMCGVWSSSSSNLCANRRDYMRINCPRSCNMCHNPAGH